MMQKHTVPADASALCSAISACASFVQWNQTLVLLQELDRHLFALVQGNVSTGFGRHRSLMSGPLVIPGGC